MRVKKVFLNDVVRAIRFNLMYKMTIFKNIMLLSLTPLKGHEVWVRANVYLYVVEHSFSSI